MASTSDMTVRVILLMRVMRLLPRCPRKEWIKLTLIRLGESNQVNYTLVCLQFQLEFSLAILCQPGTPDYSYHFFYLDRPLPTFFSRLNFAGLTLIGPTPTPPPNYSFSL
jgi:hypothetical protein